MPGITGEEAEGRLSRGKREGEGARFVYFGFDLQGYPNNLVGEMEAVHRGDSSTIALGRIRGFTFSAGVHGNGIVRVHYPFPYPVTIRFISAESPRAATDSGALRSPSSMHCCNTRDKSGVSLFTRDTHAIPLPVSTLPLEKPLPR